MNKEAPILYVLSMFVNVLFNFWSKLHLNNVKVQKMILFLLILDFFQSKNQPKSTRPYHTTVDSILPHRTGAWPHWHRLIMEGKKNTLDGYALEATLKTPVIALSTKNIQSRDVAVLHALGLITSMELQLVLVIVVNPSTT